MSKVFCKSKTLQVHDFIGVGTPMVENRLLCFYDLVHGFEDLLWPKN